MNETAPQVIHQVPPQVWIKTSVSNLYKYEPSGVYHCRAKVNGRPLRVSLKTKSFEIAKIKIAQLMVAERGRLYGVTDEDMTFAHLAAEFIDRIDQNPDMKPSAKLYRAETLLQIRRSWPDTETAIVKKLTDKDGNVTEIYRIDPLKPPAFTEAALLLWAAKLRQKYSPTRYNGAIQTMRSILQVAVDRGVLMDNPAKARKRHSNRGIPAAPVPIVAPDIPERDKFLELLNRLDAMPERKRAARMVRFLAFCGARIGSVRQIMPENIDLENNQIILPKIKFDQAENVIPMIPELRALCEELLAEYQGVGPLLQIKNPRRALQNACKEVGLPKMTNHTLRHMHVSQCIESGTPVKTIASWAGHKDGGRLILQRYAHTRNKHSQEEAAKISFGTNVKKKTEEDPYAIIAGQPPVGAASQQCTTDQPALAPTEPPEHLQHQRPLEHQPLEPQPV